MGDEKLAGESGVSLTGDRRSSMLFMDKTISQLDLENETVINNAIAGMKFTRIIIAHRS
jgi:ABC-type bacteriocin/lantibiotic exporter with double-glycine peptidase domain